MYNWRVTVLIVRANCLALLIATLHTYIHYFPAFLWWNKSCLLLNSGVRWSITNLPHLQVTLITVIRLYIIFNIIISLTLIYHHTVHCVGIAFATCCGCMRQVHQHSILIRMDETFQISWRDYSDKKHIDSWIVEECWPFLTRLGANALKNSSIHVWILYSLLVHDRESHWIRMRKCCY